MKNQRLKMKIIIISLLMLICVRNNNCLFAISNNFKFVIDTVGIPRYNVLNEEINEAIYYTYNVFSYGSPVSLMGKVANQRWSNSKYGFWTKGGGTYKGSGTRGEYYMLGRNYSGTVIHNYYFPFDSIPTVSPEKWSFHTNPGALESWTAKGNYKYPEQLEYMKKTKLLFNDLSTKEKAMNPKYIKTYNLTASMIGLNKAKLDAASTWKTNGIIYIRRLISNVIWGAIFATPPMAADAKLKTEIEVNENFLLNENTDEIFIPIKYSGEVFNATGYANKTHVKKLNLRLYIDRKQVQEISGSKTMSVGNEYRLKVTRKEFPPNKTYSVKIKVDGYLHTEFAVDGLLQHQTEKTINLKIEEKRIIVVKSNDMQTLSKITDKWVVSPLAQTYEEFNQTNNRGFTEAGRHVAIKLKLNVPKTDIMDSKIYINSLEIKEKKIYNDPDMGTNIYAISFKVPEDLNTTLFGWYSLREKHGSYYNINPLEILSRKSPAHLIRFEYKYKGKNYQEQIKFDTLDSYMKNFNEIIKAGIINSTTIKDKKDMKEWIKK